MCQICLPFIPLGQISLPRLPCSFPFSLVLYLPFVSYSLPSLTLGQIKLCAETLVLKLLSDTNLLQWGSWEPNPIIRLDSNHHYPLSHLARQENNFKDYQISFKPSDQSFQHWPGWKESYPHRKHLPRIRFFTSFCSSSLLYSSIPWKSFSFRGILTGRIGSSMICPGEMFSI